MKKIALLWAVVLAGFVAVAHADIVGSGPYVSPLTENYGVYAHVGPLNFTVPWDTVNVVYLYDLNAKRNMVGGESVFATIWKFQATAGAVTTIDGNGAPFVGGNLWFNNPIPQIAILNEVKPGVFAGYDFNRSAPIWGFKAAVNIF